MNIDCLEAVQRRFTKRLAGFRDIYYKSRLKTLGLDSLEYRRLKADLILVYKIVFDLTDLSRQIATAFDHDMQPRGGGGGPTPPPKVIK
jgi:hypothetical protein